MKCMFDGEIRQLSDGENVAALAEVARAEGFEFLDRLLREWRDGVNRFDGEGEALFGAFREGRLVGTGGLTRQRADLGRVRRVYVHPEWRRSGVATAILADVLALARSRYPAVVLYTETPEAARLYERMGFLPESTDGPDHATHRLTWAPD